MQLKSIAAEILYILKGVVKVMLYILFFISLFNVLPLECSLGKNL